MVSRKLMGFWGFLDVCLLAAAAISITFSLVWRKPDVLMNMVLSPTDLTAGFVLGLALAGTFAFSIGAIVQRNHITIGLVILNWILVVDALIIVVIGSFVWFFTLQERNNFHALWLAASRDTRLTIQDKFSCCGYFFGNDSAEVGGFCQSTDFINNLNTTVTTNFCVTPITSFADVTLNNVFSSVYGFMAIIIGLFLATMCVIKVRQEDERFKKIDAKRGGRGFV